MHEMGHVLLNRETGEVAMRSHFPLDKGDNLLRLAYFISHPRRGVRNAYPSEVEGWEDLYVPGDAVEG